MMIKPLHHLASLMIFLLFAGCQPMEETAQKVIPEPVSQRETFGFTSLKNGFTMEVDDEILAPLEDIFCQDFYLLTDLDFKSKKIAGQPVINLKIDNDMPKESYILNFKNKIDIIGGSYTAVSFGLTSLLHFLDDNIEIPKVQIHDHPASNHRALLVDLAGRWHEISNLKELIVLCSWYKINYLHLSFVNSQSFTFPSNSYPKLTTEERHYSKAELKELNEFAIQRGVILVPGINVPGHAAQFVKKMPEVFGIQNINDNYSTLNIGNEATYQVLDTLLGEVAAAFPHSPYLHIGCGQANFTGMEKDPDIISYMKTNNLPNIQELFHHFIVRLNEKVKKHEKQTIIWTGFSSEGKIEIPRDLIVMASEAQYTDLQKLQSDGFKLINASLNLPSESNNQKWSPAHILAHWNPQRWEDRVNTTPGFNGIELATNKQILGAAMYVLEQQPNNELQNLRARIPAMSEKLWSSKSNALNDFESRFAEADKKLSRLIQPFSAEKRGH